MMTKHGFNIVIGTFLSICCGTLYKDLFFL